MTHHQQTRLMPTLALWRLVSLVEFRRWSVGRHNPDWVSEAADKRARSVVNDENATGGAL
jgi:hypothetical protein